MNMKNIFFLFCKKHFHNLILIATDYWILFLGKVTSLIPLIFYRNTFYKAKAVATSSRS